MRICGFSIFTAGTKSADYLIASARMESNGSRFICLKVVRIIIATIDGEFVIYSLTTQTHQSSRKDQTVKMNEQYLQMGMNATKRRDDPRIVIELLVNVQPLLDAGKAEREILAVGLTGNQVFLASTN